MHLRGKATKAHLEQKVDREIRRDVLANASSGDVAVVLDDGESRAALDEDRKSFRRRCERSGEFGVPGEEEDCEPNRSAKGSLRGRGSERTLELGVQTVPRG